MGKVVKKCVFKSALPFFALHIKVYNLFLKNKLSRKERLILALFLALPDSIVSTYRFNKNARKKVLEVAKISTNNLSNVLNRLINKGVLRKDISTGLLVIPEQLEFKNLVNQSYEIIPELDVKHIEK